MEPSTQGAPGYYTWDVPGQPVVVHLNFDVIDRLGAEVMRGFGAVPKRGAEVGGILLGSIQSGAPSIVRIDDFEPVPCEYKRGPSYLFTEGEVEIFADAAARWDPALPKAVYAVGFYRSHTREGMWLEVEDLDLLKRCFPASQQVALLIKPFATKASTAGFFVRQSGVFPSETPQEFPFRRRELTGEAAPPRRPLEERRPKTREMPRPLAGPAAYEQPAEDIYDSELRVDTPPESEERQKRRRWMWIPLSFSFLLLGILAGFQAALTFAPGLTSNRDASDFGLNLSVSQSAESITLRWNREASALRTAQRGLLEIQDEGFVKPVELGPTDLQNGMLIYQNSSGAVRFRLTVFLSSKLTISETLDWRQ